MQELPCQSHEFIALALLLDARVTAAQHDEAHVEPYRQQTLGGQLPVGQEDARPGRPLPVEAAVTGQVHHIEAGL